MKAFMDGDDAAEQDRRRQSERQRRLSADRDRLHRWGVWAAAVLLVGGTAAALKVSRGYRRPPDARPPIAAGPADDVEADRTRVRGYKDSRPAWVVTARKVTSDRGHARVTFSEGVEATLLDVKTGAARAVVTTSGALFVNGSQTLQATGAVTCRIPPKGTKGPKPEQAAPPSRQDMEVTAETLTWNVGAKSVTCGGKVTATLPDGNGVIEGRDLSIDLDTRDTTVKNIRARFTVRESETPLSRLPF
jgi:hypothetical protein